MYDLCRLHINIMLYCGALFELFASQYCMVPLGHDSSR